MSRLILFSSLFAIILLSTNIYTANIIGNVLSLGKKMLKIKEMENFRTLKPNFKDMSISLNFDERKTYVNSKGQFKL